MTEGVDAIVSFYKTVASYLNDGPPPKEIRSTRPGKAAVDDIKELSGDPYYSYLAAVIAAHE